MKTYKENVQSSSVEQNHLFQTKIPVGLLSKHSRRPYQRYLLYTIILLFNM